MVGYREIEKGKRTVILIAIIDSVQSPGNIKADEKEWEGVDEATPSRYDYEILLDYDTSGTISRNLLESFQNILLLTNRSNLPSRTF